FGTREGQKTVVDDDVGRIEKEEPLRQESRDNVEGVLGRVGQQRIVPHPRRDRPHGGVQGRQWGFFGERAEARTRCHKFLRARSDRSREGRGTWHTPGGSAKRTGGRTTCPSQ